MDSRYNMNGPVQGYRWGPKTRIFWRIDGRHWPPRPVDQSEWRKTGFVDKREKLKTMEEKGV